MRHSHKYLLLFAECGELVSLVLVHKWLNNLLESTFDDLVEFVEREVEYMPYRHFTAGIPNTVQ